MATVGPGSSDTPATAPARRGDLMLGLRAAVLVAAGCAIAFTAPLHEDVAFNRVVFVALCAALVMLSGFQFARARRDDSGSQMSPAALGILALLAGILAATFSGAATFALVLTLWAAATALVEIWTGLRAGNRDTVTTGVLAGLLAIMLLLVGGDVVAVIGFLGAYCFIAAVYLAIAAFDFSPATGTAPTIAHPLDTETAGS